MGKVARTFAVLGSAGGLTLAGCSQGLESQSQTSVSAPGATTTAPRPETLTHDGIQYNQTIERCPKYKNVSNLGTVSVDGSLYTDTPGMFLNVGEGRNSAVAITGGGEADPNSTTHLFTPTVSIGEAYPELDFEASLIVGTFKLYVDEYSSAGQWIGGRNFFGYDAPQLANGDCTTVDIHDLELPVSNQTDSVRVQMIDFGDSDIGTVQDMSVH